MKQEGDGDTNCNCCAWYSHQKIGTGTEGLRNKRTCGDHPNNSIIKIKKFKFDHAYKWYKHSPPPVLENDTHKLL